MTSPTFRRIRLLDTRLDKITEDDVLRWADEMIGRASLNNQIVVVNVAKLVKARKEESLKDVIETAGLVCADGLPLVWVSKLFGDPLPGRVTGIDLMYALLSHGNRKRWSFFFLGATQDVVLDVVNKATEQYSNIVVAGYHNGYFGPDDEGGIVEEIAASKANILFIGFGSPRKELFVERWRSRLNVNVIHGVGGSFDVFAGKTRRAPVWMQNAGLEWFFRLVQEPVRMVPRYATTNTIFILLVIEEIFKRLIKRKGLR